MKNLKIITFILALCVINIACESDGGDSVIELQNGALGNLTIADGSATSIVNTTFATLDLEFNVDLAIGNPSSYDLRALYQTIDGDFYGPVTLDAGVTNFPKDYVISGDEVISAFSELTAPSDLMAGDVLYFYPAFTLSNGTIVETLTDNGTTNYYASDFNQIDNNNYFLQYAVSCAPQPGTYRIDMHDSYGDGWQTNDGNGGDGLQLILDGVLDQEVGLCNPYVAVNYACVDDYSNGTANVVIPEGTETAVWFYPGDQYGEISFEIYGPDDQLLLAVEAGSDGGPLSVILCAE